MHALREIRDALERERTGLIVGAVIMLLGGCVFEAMESPRARSLVGIEGALPDGAEWMLRVVALGLAFGAAYCIWRFVDRGPIDGWPLVRMLRDRAGEIVWVHPSTLIVRQRVQGVQVRESTTIFFCTDAGWSLALPVDAHRVQRVLRDAREALPHATVGDDDEALQAKWKSDPRSLRAGPAPEGDATYRADDSPRAPAPSMPHRAGAIAFVAILVASAAIVLSTPHAIDALSPKPPAPDVPILRGPQ